MKTAIITTTGQQVEIVAVNGGWTTVQTLDAATREFKVRNGQLSQHTTLTGTAVQLAQKKAEKVRTAPAAKAAKEPKAPRAKMDINERRNGRVDPLYLPQYQVYTAVRTDGRKIRSIDKGDAVAVAMRGTTLGDAYKFAAGIVGHSIADLVSRFEHLNPGMQRMSLGNMVRRVQKAGAR